MHLEIKCKACGYSFLCVPSTARIKGPLITTTCPKCKVEVPRNLSAFVGSFFEDEEVKLLQKTRAMISLAQDVASEIGQDLSFDKRKKKEKEERDAQQKQSEL